MWEGLPVAIFWAKYDMSATLPDVKLNAGYIDGRVERYHSSDAYSQNGPNLRMYITKKFR